MEEHRIKVWVQEFKDRGSLMLQWLDPDTGKRKSKSAKTDDPKKAEEARGDLESDLNSGRYAEASRMSWETFRGLFEVEYTAGLRAKTRKRYDRVFDLFEELTHPARLRSITERTVSAFTAAMRQKETWGRDGMAPSTMRVTLQFLRTALTWAADQKLIPACPGFPSVKVPKKKPKPVPVEAFERLVMKAPDENMRVYLLTGWLAGLRLAEAAALEWEPNEKAPYLDFARRRIILPAEFVKSVEDQWVPIDPLLTEALEQLPRHGCKVFHFLSRRGKPLTDNGISERIIRLAKKAGVKLSMHTLRKGFGCRYAGKVPAQVLQKLMRHGDIKTTMAFYANVDEAVEAAVFGPQCNTSRNTRPQDGGKAGSTPADTSDTNPSQASE